MNSTIRKQIDANLGTFGYVVGAMFLLALVVEPLQQAVLPLLLLAVGIVAVWSRR